MHGELQDDAPMASPGGSNRKPMRARTMLLVGAAAVGAAIGGAGIASAATGSSTSTTAAATATAPAATAPAATGGQPADPAALSHGPNETVLTGTTADKVKAAALAAEPGATIIRVETDSAGSPYEAHITKADGTEVTLKIDANFTVTATEQGFGRAPIGQAPPSSGAPSA